MATASATPTPDPNSAAWSIYLSQQNFNLTSLDGTPTTMALSDVDSYLFSAVKEVVNYAFALGFCAMLFIVLIPLTQPKQRRQPIYILNLTTLFLISFRMIVAIKNSCGSYQGIGPVFLGADAQYNAATWTPHTLTAILQIFIYITIVSSLVLQVRVVFAATPKTQTLVTWVGAFLAFAFVCLEIAWQGIQIATAYRLDMNLADYLYMYNVCGIYFLCFIGLCCLVFLYKLGGTILRRRRMGMDVSRFGPLHIIFIMFAQCMIVPCTVSLIFQTDYSGYLHH